MDDHPDTDLACLHAYVARGDQEAFACLTRRYVDLAYAAARRQVRDSALAEDVTQAVFLVLARKAAPLAGGAAGATVAGWLVKTAYLASRDMLKRERRREVRERRAAMDRPEVRETQELETAWGQIRSALDAALAQLRAGDREIITLRYLQSRTPQEVAAALGVTPVAAQKRIERAIERLRSCLGRRGVVTTAGGLAGVLAIKTAEAAPPTIAAALAAPTAQAAALAARVGAPMLWGVAKVAAAVMVMVGLAGVVAVVSGPRTPVGPAPAATAPAVASAPAGSPTSQRQGSAGMVYAGHLFDPAGKPVGGATWKSFHFDHGIFGLEQQGTTKADGSFRLAPVTPDRPGTLNRTVVFDAPGYPLAWWQPDVTDVFTDWQDLRVTLKAPPVQLSDGAIAGTVTNERGEPVRDALVELHLQSFGTRFEGGYGYLDMVDSTGLATRTDATGHFQVTRIPVGTRAHIDVVHSGYAQHSSRLDYHQDVFPLPVGTKNAAVTLHPGARFEVQLVREGQPVRQAGVVLVAHQRDSRRRTRAVTDAGGRAVFSSLVAGSWDIWEEMTPLGAAAMVMPVFATTLVTGDNRQLDLAYQPGIKVRGTLRDQRTGQGVQGDVAFYASRGGGGAGLMLQYFPTDAQGRYEVQLPPGPCRIAAYGDAGGGGSREYQKEFEAKAGVGPIDLDYHPWPQIRGQLVDRAGKPVAGAVATGFGDGVLTDEEGRFVISVRSMLEDHDVGVAFDRTRSLGRGFVFKPDQQELRLVLEPMGALAGRVVDEQGQAADDATLSMVMEFGQGGLAPGRWIWSTTRQSNGRFRIAPVPIGYSLMMTAKRPGFQTTAQVSNLTPGDTRDLPMILEPLSPRMGGKTPWDATVRGTIVDEAGKPVAHERITASLNDAVDNLTDEAGRFELHKLPRDRDVTVAAYRDGYGHCQWTVHTAKAGDMDAGSLKMLPLGYELVGKPAPELFVRKWLNRGPAKWEDYRGKVVILQVGVTREGYMAGNEQVLKAYEKFSKQGVVLVAVHQATYGVAEEEKVAEWVDDNDINFPFGIDQDLSHAPAWVKHPIGNGLTYSIYDTRVSPTTYLIDKKGILRVSPKRDELTQWLTKLLQEN